MAPPAHTDPGNWSAQQKLARRHHDAVAAADLLDAQGVTALFCPNETADTSAATQTRLDAVINHLIGVQVLPEHFIATVFLDMARHKATQTGITA